MGAACPTANVLTETGLRLFSGPYDWVSGMGCCERLVLMLSDFDGYLNCEALRLTSTEPDARGHISVINDANGVSFPHDFCSSDIQTDYPEVKEKYERRIARLKRLMQDAAVLMVYITKETESRPNALPLLEEIRKKFKCKRADLLYCFIGEEDDLELSYVERSDGAVLIGMALPKNMRDIDDWLGDRRLYSVLDRCVYAACVLQ